MDYTDVFSFQNYRNYLQSWLKIAKETKRSNLTHLSKVAQIHATFLSQVLLGKKDLSLEQAILLSQHFGHSRLERDYFLTLVQLERPSSLEVKKYWREKKTEIESQKNKLSQRFEKHQELSSEQKAIFYSSWLYSAIRVSTAVEGGQRTDQVVDRFKISKDKAEEILSFLVQTGLCIERDGLFLLGEAHTHVSNESPFVVKHHTNWRVRAINKMDQREPDELFFTAPMSISKADFALIRERLNQTIKELVDIAKNSSAEDVVCLEIDFFRLNK